MLFQRRGQGSALAGSLRRGAQGELLTGPPDTKSRQGALPASLRTSQNAQVPHFRKTGKGPPHGLCAAGALKQVLYTAAGVSRGAAKGRGRAKGGFFKAGPMPPAAFSVMTAGGFWRSLEASGFFGGACLRPTAEAGSQEFPTFLLEMLSSRPRFCMTLL